MAGEEDVELRDLVAQTLEAKGVLGKIRAQLRSSVFLALEEQESKEKSHPLVNERLQKYLKTKEGQLTTSLVREFLEFFELDFTCAVFDPETNVLETYPGRDRLAQEVGLESQASTSCPLLASVLQRAAQSPVLRQLRFPDLGPSVTTPSPTITESGRTSSIVSTLADIVTPYSHATSTRAASTSASTYLDAHKTRSEATTVVTSSVKTIPSTSVPTSSGAPSLGTSLNTNENSNLRLEPQAMHPNASSLSVLSKPPLGVETNPELGTTFMNSTLDFETLLNSGEDVEKLLMQARGRESSKDELDDFFETSIPSALDEMKETDKMRPSRPPLEDALGTTGMSKNLDPLSSLRDAPTLTASSLQGAPPLGASGSNLVGKRGSQVDKTNLRLDAGSSEYEDEFDSEGGGTISEHIETPSDSKLDTRDSTFSDSSLGDFDHVEKVKS